MFKSAIREASQSLPVLPNKQPVEWMTEELLNLSHKKRDAWMRLQNKDPKSDDPTLQQEYTHTTHTHTHVRMHLLYVLYGST